MRTALVFGYGQKRDGSIDEQTQNRCEKAVQLYRQGKIQKIYLTVSASKNGVSMAEAMRDFLVCQGVKETDIVIERRGGNTAGEMDLFLSLLPHDSKAIFVSTWYHLPRIFWLAIWRIPAARFSLSVAWRHAHFKADVLIEFAKLANAILRPRRSAKVMAKAPTLS